MTRQGSVRVIIGLGALALVLAACGGGTKTPSAPRLTNTLTITGSEYRFELDKPSIDQGTAQVTFKNTGAEIHMAIWAKLKQGVTFQQFTQALPKGEEAFGLVEEADDGSPGILTPGQQSTQTTNLLKAGTYALVCFIPAPDKAPHAAKGMVASLEVKGAAATASPSPFAVTSDADVTMTDYSFGTIPEALKKGKGTFKFVNTGKQPHEATLVKLEPGKTFDDADKYFNALFEGPTPTGPMPAQLVGGFFSIAPGTEIWLTIDLPPGSYVLVCGEETDDGKAHEDLGMKTEFTVA